MGVLNEGDAVIIDGESYLCVLANHSYAAIGRENKSDGKTIVVIDDCKVISNMADSLKLIGVEKIFDRYGKEKAIENVIKVGGEMTRWIPPNET